MSDNSSEQVSNKKTSISNGPGRNNWINIGFGVGLGMVLTGYGASLVVRAWKAPAEMVCKHSYTAIPQAPGKTMTITKSANGTCLIALTSGD